MGHQAEDILTSLKLTQDELKKYDTVKAKLDSYFVIRRNVIFERSKFNKRVQLENETVDSFVTDLHCMAGHCQFGDINDELIRDRLVVGLRDTRLAERLQLDPELTLEKAVNQARQSEAVKKQQVLLRDDQSSYGAKETVDAVHKSKLYRKKEQQKRKDQGHTATQALHGLAPKCKLINMHELINKSTNHYVTLLPCKNGANVNNKG